MTSKDQFAQLWKVEAKTTANSFRSVPADKWDYRPHQKTRSAKELLGHLTTHGKAVIGGLQTGEISLGADETVGSPEEAAKIVESSAQEIEQLVNTTDEKTWNEKVIPMYFGVNKVYEATMGNMLWTFLLDVIHHRGQLSTYYRPMGTRNPSIYGPTAESMEEQIASSGN